MIVKTKDDELTLMTQFNRDAVERRIYGRHSHSKGSFPYLRRDGACNTSILMVHFMSQLMDATKLMMSLDLHECCTEMVQCCSKYDRVASLCEVARSLFDVFKSQKETSQYSIRHDECVKPISLTTLFSLIVPSRAENSLSSLHNPVQFNIHSLKHTHTHMRKNTLLKNNNFSVCENIFTSIISLASLHSLAAVLFAEFYFKSCKTFFSMRLHNQSIF
jgi:hypothetical protein